MGRGYDPAPAVTPAQMATTQQNEEPKETPKVVESPARVEGRGDDQPVARP